jgi:hypothetical protein
MVASFLGLITHFGGYTMHARSKRGDGAQFAVEYCDVTVGAQARTRAPGGGENKLRAVLPRPLKDYVDGRAAALARAQLEAFNDHRIGGPLVEADRMAVHPLKISRPD